MWVRLVACSVTNVPGASTSNLTISAGTWGLEKRPTALPSAPMSETDSMCLPSVTALASPCTGAK
jgi:hypothetical protein